MFTEIVAVLACFTPWVTSYFEGCGRCEEEFCPKMGEECLRGLVRDPCGCCPNGVCALAQGEKCFNGEFGLAFPDSGLRKYGICGDYMECVSRTDLRQNGEVMYRNLPTRDRPESVCICKHTEPVCGSDNATYDTLCEMRFADVNLLHYGPCLTKPVIVSGPLATGTYEGSSFALDCEAKGYPVPSITWEFHSLTGIMSILPGDDSNIVVHSRGGPENYMLTSWLQIESLRKNDSGRYICAARNSEGEDRAMTAVHVSA